MTLSLSSPNFVDLYHKAPSFLQAKSFFLNNSGSIKKIVDKIKKRVELRPDPAITEDMEVAEKEIRSESFIEKQDSWP